MSRYEEQAKTISVKNNNPSKLADVIRGVSNKYARADNMQLDELVEHFIVRDSESNI